MANIRNLLQNILSAVYGKDVRQSIHDAIEQCYADAIRPGYYTPSVNVNGDLSWSASEPYMAELPQTNIKGPTYNLTLQDKIQIATLAVDEMKIGWFQPIYIESYQNSMRVSNLDTDTIYRLGNVTFEPVKITSFEGSNNYGPPAGGTDTYGDFEVYWEEGAAWISIHNPAVLSVPLYEIRKYDPPYSGGDSGSEGTPFTITFIPEDPMNTGPLNGLTVILSNSNTGDEKTLSSSDLISDGDNHTFTSDTSTWDRVRFEAMSGWATIRGTTSASISDEDGTHDHECDIAGDITVTYGIR